MEEIALINPPRKNRRRRTARRRNSPRRRTSVRRRTTRRARNPELMLLNPGQRSRRRKNRRRRGSPSNMPARRHYRRNPGMMSDFLPSSAINQIAWGAGGALGTAVLSKLLLPNATGAMGFLRDAASVLGIGWVAKQVGGREAQVAAIVGGGTILAVKILNTMGIGKGIGLSEVAADDYSELGAYYEEPSLSAYYEEPSLSAYYEEPSLSAYGGDPSTSRRRRPSWLRSGTLSDDELDDWDDLSDDELGDDELDDDELDDDELGNDDELDDDELDDDELGEDIPEGPGLFDEDEMF